MGVRMRVEEFDEASAEESRTDAGRSFSPTVRSSDGILRGASAGPLGFRNGMPTGLCRGSENRRNRVSKRCVTRDEDPETRFAGRHSTSLATIRSMLCRSFLTATDDPRRSIATDPNSILQSSLPNRARIDSIGALRRTERVSRKVCVSTAKSSLRVWKDSGWVPIVRQRSEIYARTEILAKGRFWLQQTRKRPSGSLKQTDGVGKCLCKFLSDVLFARPLVDAQEQASFDRRKTPSSGGMGNPNW